MKNLFSILFILYLILIPSHVRCQNFTKVIFDKHDTTNGYYLAIPPASVNIKGVQVLFLSFNKPESVLPESKLQNVTYGNNILTVIASLKTALWADSVTVSRIDRILKNVSEKYSADNSKFILGGYMFAGNVILRYAELANEYPSSYFIHPKAVFTIACPVDLVGLYHWCEREIKKNFSPGTVGDANYILKTFKEQIGPISDSLNKYIQASPFYKDAQSPGNEQFLKNIPVRLYYDTDINWELTNRRNSYYDTYIPDGSELINRLLLLGNKDAEFVVSKYPGIKSNGIRNAYAWSIVDEVECIQWEKKVLHIFDPNNYDPEYHLPSPGSWSIERIPFPIDFAPQIKYEGMEDLRFAPGWGDKNENDYWSYAYLWWLMGTLDINADQLKKDLTDYYSGLVNRNIPIRNIPSDKLIPTVVTLTKTKTAFKDTETYSGKVDMLDYMSQQPMILNIVIHEMACPDQDKTAIIFEVSPKNANDSIWQKLDRLWMGFDCVK